MCSAPGLVRHVLSDWHLDGAGTPRAEVLRWTAAGFAPDRARRPARRARRRERLAVALAPPAHAWSGGPIPEPLWQLTLARFPFLAARSDADLQALRDMATLFLAGKEFSGARGLEVSDEMAVAIAAQACLPALKLGLRWLDGFVGIVVHEDAVVAPRELDDEDGIVHA